MGQMQGQQQRTGGRGQGGGQREASQNFQGPSKDELEQIIEQGNVVLLVEWADKVGQALAAKGLSTSQIRNVFGTVRQIQLRWDKPGSDAEQQAFRDAVLLRPKLAYFAERGKGGERGTAGMEILQLVLDPALELVGEGNKPRLDRFSRFAEFFEAIVAYHKRHGGK